MLAIRIFPNFSGRPMACAKLLGLTLPWRGALRFGNGIGAHHHPAPEWQTQIRNARNYAFVVNADGTFQVDSVAPGSYNINVSARAGGDRSFMNPPIAQGSLQFTVPESANPLNTIALGEIMLRSTPPISNRTSTFQ